MQRELFIECGNRLKIFRKELGLSQKELALKLNNEQAAISKIENGQGGSIIFFIKMLEFYSKHFLINFLFSADFHLVAVDNKKTSKSTLDSVVVELLENAIREHKTNVVSTEQNLKKAIDRAKELLNE